MSSLKLTPEMAKLFIDVGAEITGKVLAWRRSRNKPLDPEITAEDIRESGALIEKEDDILGPPPE